MNGEGRIMENKEVIQKIREIVSRAWDVIGENLKQSGIQFNEIINTAIEVQATLTETMGTIARTRVKILAKIINEDPNPWNRMHAMFQLSVLLATLFEIFGQERAERIIFG